MIYFSSGYEPSVLPREVFGRLMSALGDHQPATPRRQKFVTFAQLPDNITSLPSFPAPKDSHSVWALQGDEEPSAGRKLVVPRTSGNGVETSPGPIDNNSCNDNISREDKNGNHFPLTFARFRALKQRLYPRRPFNKAVIAEALAPQDQLQTVLPQLHPVRSPAV